MHRIVLLSEKVFQKPLSRSVKETDISQNTPLPKKSLLNIFPTFHMSPLILSRNLIKWMVPLSGLPSFGTAASCTEVHMVWAPQCRSLTSQTCSLIVSSLSPRATEYFRKGQNTSNWEDVPWTSNSEHS